MRRLLTICHLLSAICCGSAAGVVVTNDVRFYNQATDTLKIMLTAYNTPQQIGGSLVVGENILWGATNGAFSITLDAGYYLVKFPGLTRGFNITVPSSGGPYALTALSTNLPTFSYTNGALSRISSHVLKGSNVTFATNNAGLPDEQLVIGSDGGGAENTNALTASQQAILDLAKTNVTGSTGIAVSQTAHGAQVSVSAIPSTSLADFASINDGSLVRRNGSTLTGTDESTLNVAHADTATDATFATEATKARGLLDTDNADALTVTLTRLIATAGHLFTGNGQELTNITEVANATNTARLAIQLGGSFDAINAALNSTNTARLATQLGGNFQPLDADLTTYAGITPSANVQSLLGAASYSAMRSQLSLVPGTDVQAFDSDLTTWSGITPGSGVGTFLATPSSANLATAVTDETGSGSLVFSASPTLTGAPALAAATATTASANDSSTKVATTAYVQGELTAYAGDTATFTGKTLDASATGNTLKFKSYITLKGFDNATGALPVNTNDLTASTFMQPVFLNGTDKASNYIEWRLRVPPDIDTSVDLRGAVSFKLGNTDTGGHRYVLSFASVATSAAYSGSPSTEVNLDFAGDASGASGDLEQVGLTTLTSWAAGLTANNLWVIRLARDGDTSDSSTVDSYFGELTIEYGVTQ